MVYVEKKIELPWLIGSGVVFDKNQTGKWCDWSYKCSLLWKETDWSWSIRLGVVYDKNQTGQQRDQSYRDSIYAKSETMLSLSIGSSVIFDEN